MAENKKVIIAGAGSEGLLAARERTPAGFNVRAFEALDEIWHSTTGRTLLSLNKRIMFW